jgi:hypothetical protein
LNQHVIPKPWYSLWDKVLIDSSIIGLMHDQKVWLIHDIKKFMISVKQYWQGNQKSAMIN